MNHRPEREARVRSATRDDDLPALIERLSYRPPAEIDVRACDSRPDRRERLSRVQVFERDASLDVIVEAVHYVVARDYADLHATAEACAPRNIDYRVAARFGVDAARVRHNFDVALDKLRQNLFDHLHEIASVTRARVARALFLHDRHGYLRQIIEGQVIDRPAPHKLDGGVKRIAPESLPVSNPDSFHNLLNLGLWRRQIPGLDFILKARARVAAVAERLVV